MEIYWVQANVIAIRITYKGFGETTENLWLRTSSRYQVQVVEIFFVTTDGKFLVKATTAEGMMPDKETLRQINDSEVN